MKLSELRQALERLAAVMTDDPQCYLQIEDVNEVMTVDAALGNVLPKQSVASYWHEGKLVNSEVVLAGVVAVPE